MKNLIYILCLLPMAYFISCGGSSSPDVDTERIPIVSVKEDVLYKAGLDAALPKNLPQEDSIQMAKQYIAMWINDKLMYDKAEQNVMNRDEIDAMVRDYRRSLVINSYTNQLLREQFFSNVSDAELLAYYNANKEHFNLKEDIIKGLYLKVPADSHELANFQKWYRQGNDAAVENIEKNTLQNAVGYEYFYGRWVSFNEVIENMPLTIDNTQQYLRANKNIEVRDSSFVYLLNIREYKLAGTEAPYEYMKSHLLEIYTEQRRADYLKQVEKDLYDKALLDEEITFFK